MAVKILAHALSKCTVFTLTADKHASLGVDNKINDVKYCCYLVVQLPFLIIPTHASPAKEAHVVDLDQLPLWPMAEVPEEPGKWFTETQILDKTVPEIQIHPFQIWNKEQLQIWSLAFILTDEIKFPLVKSHRGESQEKLIPKAWCLFYSSWTVRLCLCSRDNVIVRFRLHQDPVHKQRCRRETVTVPLLPFIETDPGFKMGKNKNPTVVNARASVSIYQFLSICGG